MFQKRKINRLIHTCIWNSSIFDTRFPKSKDFVEVSTRGSIFKEKVFVYYASPDFNKCLLSSWSWVPVVEARPHDRSSHVKEFKHDIRRQLEKIYTRAQKRRLLILDNLRILVGETQTSNYRETRNTLV